MLEGADSVRLLCEIAPLAKSGSDSPEVSYGRFKRVTQMGLATEREKQKNLRRCA